LKLALVKEDKTSIYIRANGHLARGCYDLAEELYCKLIRLDDSGDKLEPEIHADILHNLGMIAEKRHDYDLAIHYYGQSVVINSERSRTWVFLAKSYFNRFEKSGDLSDHKAAFAALQKAEASPVNYPIIKILKEKYSSQYNSID